MNPKWLATWYLFMPINHLLCTQPVQNYKFLQVKEENSFIYCQFDGFALNPSHRSYVSCLSACTKRSQTCSAVQFRINTGECTGFGTNPIIDANGYFEMVSRDVSWTSFRLEIDYGDLWNLVFKATNNFGSVYNTYIGTDTVIQPTREHLSLDATCNTGCWYKHPLVENWSNVDIFQVKLALYEGGEEVVSLVFDGSGSDKTNWFSHSRLISSPWSDLKTSNPNFFGIEGDNIWIRRFFINKEYNGCGGDNGWFLVRDNTHGSGGTCAWESTSSSSKFAYSKLSTSLLWEVRGALSSDVGEASVLAIFVKLRH